MKPKAAIEVIELEQCRSDTGWFPIDVPPWLRKTKGEQMSDAKTTVTGWPYNNTISVNRVEGEDETTVIKLAPDEAEHLAAQLIATVHKMTGYDSGPDLVWISVRDDLRAAPEQARELAHMLRGLVDSFPGASDVIQELAAAIDVQAHAKDST